MALLLAASRRFALPIWRNVALLCAGLGFSLGLSIALARPVPALPGICGAFLLGNLTVLRLTRREWLLTAAVSVALVAAVVVGTR
jgi:hypothetical protein